MYCVPLGLLDPKWVEEQSKTTVQGPGQEEVYAPGSSIGSSLKQLAERRTDIFGSGAEEAQIGKKVCTYTCGLFKVVVHHMNVSAAGGLVVRILC